MRSTRAIGRLSLALLIAALGGCGGQYRVELSNESGRTAVASVTHGGGFDGSRTLATKAVPSGETVELGPFQAPGFEGVRISVTRPGDVGAMPTETRLRRGYNAFVIEAGGVDSWEAVVLRRVE